MYPYTRLRRTRKHAWLRELVSESRLSTSDLILPIFIIEGEKVREEIKSMPGVYRLSIDEAIKEVERAHALGINAVALFPTIESTKTEDAKEAANPNNLICRAIRAIKKQGMNIGIICDVALDPYTSHGHDGILKNSYVHNDGTIDILLAQSLVLVEAGADILALSDMMDGRVKLIREMLEKNHYTDIPIISYAVKYASSLYGPFRNAVRSKLSPGENKKTYQMDYRNSREAELEAELDIEEGTDIIMVKPGIFYLDIIYKLAQSCRVPIFAYQVSGEYSMLKYTSFESGLGYNDLLIESLYCIKRAGAKSIFTYGAIDAAKIIQNKS